MIAALLAWLLESPPEQTVQLGQLVMTKALALGGVAFLIGLTLGRPLINELRRRRLGKQIRIDGPQSHMVKTGTPTMGGLIFLVTIVICIVAFMDIVRFKSLLLPLGIIISCGVLGAVDDRLSIVGGKAREGMKARFKMLWLLLIAGVAAWVLHYPLKLTSIYIPFISNTRGFDIGLWYIPIVIIAVAGAANAVNISDGLDTLAGGMAAMSFLAYGVIAYLQRQEPVVYLCFAVVGALLAFLWYNAHPAQVIMGDTGSLTLGALLAVCAFMTGQWLVLPMVGIVFVAVAASSVLQVIYFRLTGGKRLFKMAPLHHHFELLGWSETQVAMRFWLISMLGGMLGVALALA
ncbi:MAG TPA: phospho-N-acetylmuramoyl-pentapeptide-transferase [Chloroflexia bacterium]|nr:phospho-N-acetylmuramoyl-pentapeptide-transferase [Chloroflexia bacterium]